MPGERLDLIVTLLRDHTAEDRAWHERLDARLSKIEAAQAAQAGRSSVFGGIYSLALALLSGAFGGYLSRHLG